MDADLERWMKAAAVVLPEFHEAWHAAMTLYRKYPAEAVAEHRDRTAAGSVNDHMIKEVIRRFGERRGFKILDVRGMLVLSDHDRIVWRFKKVDGGGRHRNYRTKQQRAYDNQLPLPGVPGRAVRLTSGYQPDIAFQSIERVIVSRPLGRTVQWAAQVNVVDNVASWTEITPQRLPGMDGIGRARKGGRK